MLAGLLIVSVPFGFVAVGASVLLDASIWISLAAYPAASGAALLTIATLTSLRSMRPVPQHSPLQHSRLHG